MSFKLLEISILSAQDLAPVSKLLRTYAVVWVHPDQKLTTRVDHHGHTNPTWNYRFVFRVDDNFLSAAAASALTVEIYNATWLRDIPVGSAHALISSLLPQNNYSSNLKRFISLQIRRPSGALHGVLNLGVNLIDSSRRSLPLDSQLSRQSASAADGDDRNLSVNRSQQKFSKRNHVNLDEEEEKNAKIRKLRRSKSERTDDESLSKVGSVFSGGGLSFRKFPKSKATAAGSVSSFYMRPLPSEVAESMAKGLYSTTSSDEIGSSILENWTVVDGGKEVAKPKAVRWKTDEFGPTSERSMSKKRSSSGGGLLSCFGILCGYECNIVCGSPRSKKEKKSKKRFGESKVYIDHSAENLGLLYR